MPAAPARDYATIILLSGLPGAGKTTFAQALCQRLGAVHVESDAIRRSLFPEPAYSPAEHARVFAAVERMAARALHHRRAAVIDATNLTRSDRARFFALAGRFGSPVIAVRVTAPYETLAARLSAPREGSSQATPLVLELMRDRGRPFSVPCVVADTRFDTSPALDLVDRLVHDREG